MRFCVGELRRKLDSSPATRDELIGFLRFGSLIEGVTTKRPQRFLAPLLRQDQFSLLAADRSCDPSRKLQAGIEFVMNSQAARADRWTSVITSWR